MMRIDGKTAVYGILGNPVSHSLSPAMHNAAFAALGENRIYLPFQAVDISSAVQGIRALNIKGVSVTIPHKEMVISLLDEVDSVAMKIGAVNTIEVVLTDQGNILRGSNSDWVGANRALSQHVDLTGQVVVILGAGGSARAIAFGLQEAGSRVILCSRTESRGRKLATELGCNWHPLAEIGQLAGTVLVNATSVGMTPDENGTLVRQEHLAKFKVVMDIVYAPLETRLLREARLAGCRVVQGLDMLLYQGVAQFELWTGLPAPVEVMRKALLAATGNMGR
ncbi:MAG: shikimate dehydrogenase [Desulfoprunum sp.]|nr:shikimate dehydrogenase [Desulfoprunum sp.]